MNPARIRYLAPFLLLGPLTGPLVAGLMSTLSAQRPWMALVYGLGLVEVILGLPAILTKELAVLAHLQTGFHRHW